jgi:hypothetical protein
MRENNIIHHTYQPKEERSYRVVIKYLHNSVDIQDLKAEISQHGLSVRNIINAKIRVINDPLNLFFVDLQPSGNNKDIYKITKLQNSVIQMEPLRKGKHLVHLLVYYKKQHDKLLSHRFTKKMF